MLNFKEELIGLKAKGLERKMQTIQSAADTHIKIGRKQVLNFCSNNYLGLANDRRLKKAAIEAIKEFGVGSGASRLVSGNNILHQKLEKALARFKGKESSLVYTTGYSANLGIISSLVGRDDVVFCDRLNHASIIDGIVLSRAELVRYPHKDLNALEYQLKKNSYRKKKLIITDSIFSMDGDIAPVVELIDLANRYDCLLMLDEAHATGVLGKKGRGALEYFECPPNERIIAMGTLSKALGCLGGFICGQKEMIDFLINRSRPFIFTTALPAPIAAAALCALEIIEKDCSLRERLWENINFLREGLKAIGFDTLGSQTQIIPVLTREPKLTMEFSRQLLKEGIFVQGIRPPTVPQGASRLRVTVMATHKRKDLEFALEKFRKIGRKLDVV